MNRGGGDDDIGGSSRRRGDRAPRKKESPAESSRRGQVYEETTGTFDDLGAEVPGFGDEATDSFGRVKNKPSDGKPSRDNFGDSEKTQMVNLKDVYQRREQDPNRVLSGATAVVRLADVEKRLQQRDGEETRPKHRRRDERKGRTEPKPRRKGPSKPSKGAGDSVPRTAPPPVPVSGKTGASEARVRKGERPREKGAANSSGKNRNRRPENAHAPSRNAHPQQTVVEDAKRRVPSRRERDDPRALKTRKTLDVAASPPSVQVDFTPSEEHPAPSAPKGSPRRIVFFAPKGGVGSTLISVNVGATLAQMGLETVVLDMDLQLGTVPLCLGTEPQRSIAELMIEADKTGGKPLYAGLDRHESGLAFAAQTKIEELGDITAARVPRLFEALSGGFDYVLVDGLRDFSDHAITVMDMADLVVMVVTQDVPAVRSASRALSVFKQLGYPAEQVWVVINRYSKKAGVSPEAIVRVLGREVDAYVANDFPLVEAALNDGRLLAEIKTTAPTVRDLRALTGALIGRPEAPKKKGLISRLFGRK